MSGLDRTNGFHAAFNDERCADLRDIHGSFCVIQQRQALLECQGIQCSLQLHNAFLLVCLNLHDTVTQNPEPLKTENSRKNKGWNFVLRQNCRIRILFWMHALTNM